MVEAQDTESVILRVNKKAKANMKHCCEQIMMPRRGKQMGNASTTLLLTQKFYLMSGVSEAEHCHYAHWLEIVHFRFEHLSKA